jgi:hypothetical protein
MPARWRTPHCWRRSGAGRGAGRRGHWDRRGRDGGVGRAGRPRGRAGGAGDRLARHEGADEAADLAGAFGQAAFAARTGLPASALCTLAKLRWQRGHLAPAAEARGWLGIPEWVAHRLGAPGVAERSLASRTGAFSLADARWWPDALAWLGVSDDFFPSRCTPARRWAARPRAPRGCAARR